MAVGQRLRHVIESQQFSRTLLEELFARSDEIKREPHRFMGRLAGQVMAGGDPAGAEQYLRRAMAVDPLREGAQRALMRALASGGSYAAALLTYRQLRLLLHREVNAEPDPETRALFEQIRAEARTRAQRRPPTSERGPSAVHAESGVPAAAPTPLARSSARPAWSSIRRSPRRS